MKESGPFWCGLARPIKNSLYVISECEAIIYGRIGSGGSARLFLERGVVLVFNNSKFKFKCILMSAYVNICHVYEPSIC